MKAILTGIFMLGGLFFFLVSTIGMIRFPDVFTRAHSAAKCDTLGLFLSVVGLIIYSGFSFVSLKLILIIVFIWIASPTATHLIIKEEYLRINSSKSETEGKNNGNI